MAIKDWNGFKKSGDTYIPNDATARAGVTATVDLLKDTTGWTGKNKIYPTRGDLDTAGIYFKVNTDKTVKPSGTSTSGVVFVYNSAFTCKANQKYILTGCPDGGSYNGYFVGAYIDNDITDERKDIGNGVELQFNADTVINTRLRLPNGFTPPADFLFSPMLCTAEEYELDPTYEPHHGSVEEVKADKSSVISVLNDTVGWVGQNKIPFPYNLSDVSGSGITFTADANGVVDADGTTSGVSSLYFSRRDGVAGNKMLLPAGTWKVVGGKSTNAYLSVGCTENNAYKLIGTDTGNGFVFTLTEPTYIQISLDIYNTTVSHEKISPMVCTKEQYDLSPSFKPPHESVAEMLDGKADDMCTAGNHTLYMIATAITPSNGQPEFFIPWSNPKKKNITLGNNFEVYMRKNSSWTKLTWSANPVITRAENGFYVGLTLDEALTPEEVFGFRVQGDIVFS